MPYALAHLKIEDPLLELAMALEKVALEDDYFISRKLYPNVDFYSGICFRALGIPLNMFTVVFAVGRSVGWISQWCEMAGETPRENLEAEADVPGELERRFVPVAERGGDQDEGDERVSWADELERRLVDVRVAKTVA